jgi:hypothetical protein
MLDRKVHSYYTNRYNKNKMSFLQTLINNLYKFFVCLAYFTQSLDVLKRCKDNK